MGQRRTPATGGAIRARNPWTRGNRLVGYDFARKRLWVGGQRMHHGATGVALAAAGVLGITAHRVEARRAIAWTLAGSAMVAHDWKDRSLWFRGGLQAD